jgi:hypothetical protein
MKRRYGVRLLLAVASIAMIGGVVAGLHVLGTPAHQRALQLDQGRLSDLSRLSFGIHAYWTQHKSLPVELDAIGPSITSSKDPITGVRYTYSEIDSASYSLCATFDVASEQWSGRIAMPYYTPNAVLWKHPAGHYCFHFSADGNGNPIE